MKDDDDKAIAAIGPLCSTHKQAPFTRFNTDGTVRDAGIIIPAEDGQAMPPGAEYVQCRRREDGMYDVETLARGPAKVTSPAYRANYDGIFGSKQEVGQA